MPIWRNPTKIRCRRLLPWPCRYVGVDLITANQGSDHLKCPKCGWYLDVETQDLGDGYAIYYKGKLMGTAERPPREPVGLPRFPGAFGGGS